MSSLLKDLYSPAFINRFAAVVADVIPSFDPKKFSRQIFADNWETKELKERMRHISLVLHPFLPNGFNKAAKALDRIILQLNKTGFTENSLEFMFLPDYIEVFGREDFSAAVHAIESVTQFTSCEFAVRPFLLKYEKEMLAQMYQWSLHPNHKVRRLASEGTRPRLPWAMAIPYLKKDPSPILPLLENLKNDPSEWVRRSVANNLNDVSKDHPQVVIGIARKWKGIGKETDAIIKHGCRTLLKQGHPDILQYYGLSNSSTLEIKKATIRTPAVKIGKDLAFAFTLHNNSGETQTVRLEYGLYYLRQNGQLSRKVFKISERIMQAGEKLEINRKQSFRLITTRTFYPGQQKLSIIINGQERKIMQFSLTD